MKQIFMTHVGVEVREVPAPQVQPGSVLVRVTRSCISVGTEMSGLRESKTPLWKRAMQRPAQARQLAEIAMEQGLRAAENVVRTKLSEATAIGYSAAGQVIAVGDDVFKFAVGDRIACAGSSNAYHAEFICVPSNLCVEVPEAVSDRDAATVTLGAIALQGVRRLQPTLGESVVVVGLGTIGQITVQLLKSAGVRVIGIDLDRGRLDLASAAGLDAAVHPDDIDQITQPFRLTGGYGADGVIITAASPSDEILSNAFRMCRRKARVVLVGDVGLDIKRSDIYEKELDFLISTSYGPGRYDRNYEEEGLDYPIAYVRWTENRNMSEYLRQIADGRVQLESFPSVVYPVDRAAEAYAALSDPSQRPLSAFIDYGPDVARQPSHRISMRTRRADSREGAIRVALIGTGSFAKSMHLPLLQRMSDDFSLYAVAGRRGHEAANLATQYKAAVSATETDSIISDPKVDAVLIATRHDSHADFVVKALENGKHVFVEKPLCLNRTELKRIISVVARLGERSPVLMTGFNRRFSPHAIAAKRQLAARSNPFIADYRVNAGYIPLDHWVHGSQGGGRNIGEASHFYDLMGYFAGSEIASVEARAVRPATGHYSSSDNFVATLAFKDGSISNLIYTALGSSDHPKELIDIYSDGRVLQILDFREFKVAGAKTKQLSGADKGHAAELKAFARAVRGETPWPISLEDQNQAMNIAFDVEDNLAKKSYPNSYE